MNKETIEKQLAALFSCPATEIAETDSVAEMIDTVVPEQVVQVVGATEDERFFQAQAERLVQLERDYPVRCYLTPDGLQAGIYLDPSLRERGIAIEVLRQVKAVFFGPAHEYICCRYAKELVAQWRRNGRRKFAKQYTGVSDGNAARTE